MKESRKRRTAYSTSSNFSLQDVNNLFVRSIRQRTDQKSEEGRDNESIRLNRNEIIKVNGPTAIRQEVHNITGSTLNNPAIDTNNDVLPMHLYGDSDEEHETIPSEERTLGLLQNRQTDVIPNLVDFQKIATKFVTPEYLLGIICLAGKLQLSSEQYDIFRTITSLLNSNINLPTLKTVKDTVWSHFIANCLPESTVHRVAIVENIDIHTDDSTNERQHVEDFTSNQPGFDNKNKICPPEYLPRQFEATANLNNSNSLENLQNARIVLPSAWAKLDIATLPVYQNIFYPSNGKNVEDIQLSIEHSSIVRNRWQFTKGYSSIWVQHADGSLLPGSVGDIVQFRSVLQFSRLTTHEKDVWNWTDASTIVDSATDVQYSRGQLTIEASLGPLRCLKDKSVDNDPFLQNMKAFNHHTEILLREEEKTVESFLNAEAAASFDGNEVNGDVLQRTRKNRINSSRNCIANRLKLVYGDTCLFLRKRSTIEERHDNVVLVLVCNHWKLYKDCPAERLMWIDVSNISRRSLAPTDVLCSTIVCGSPIMVKSVPANKTYNENSFFNNRGRNNTGFLKNGDHFKVYRLALFIDGFNSSSMGYAKDSMAGCYMTAMGQHPSVRSTTSSVRVISLTRGEKAANEVLKIITEDIVKGTTEGFKCIDAYGQKVTLFLDTVLFVADYLESAKVIDLMGHASNHPCTLCIMYKKKHGKGSKLGHSVEINSTKLAFSRFDERTYIFKKKWSCNKQRRFARNEYWRRRNL